jgi:hypothetical protein
MLRAASLPLSVSFAASAGLYLRSTQHAQKEEKKKKAVGSIEKSNLEAPGRQ